MVQKNTPSVVRGRDRLLEVRKFDWTTIGPLVENTPGACLSRGVVYFPGDCGPLLSRALNSVEVPPWDLFQGKLPSPNQKALRPYQTEAIRFAKSRERCAFALPPGSGKSLTALDAAEAFAPKTRVLVVCPAVVKGVWRGQLARWASSKSTVILKGLSPDAWLEGKHRWKGHFASGYEILEDAQVVVTNFDIVSAWAAPIMQLWTPVTMIVDELHLIKNREAQRTEAIFGDVHQPNAQRLVYGVPFKIGLSGTLMPNRNIELHSVLSVINPGWYGNHFNWGVAYCGAVHNGFGWDYSGRPAKGSFEEFALNSRYHEIVYWRAKDDILSDLPPKTRQVVPVDVADPRKASLPTSRKVLEQLAGPGTSFKSYTTSKAPALEGWTRAAHEAAKQKIPLTVDFVRSLGARKVVVFAHEIAHVEAIAKKLVKSFDLVYKVSAQAIPNPDRRKECADAFNAFPGTACFVAVGKSMGLGIDLSATEVIVMHDLSSTDAVVPANLLQLEDRGHRIGLTHGLNVYYMCARGTIDELVCTYVCDKLESIGRVEGSDAQREGLAATFSNPSGISEDEAMGQLATDLLEWHAAQGQRFDLGDPLGGFEAIGEEDSE